MIDCGAETAQVFSYMLDGACVVKAFFTIAMRNFYYKNNYDE